MGSVRRRRIWLIATVAALLTLQAPLCGLACLESSESGPMAASEAMDSPCHESAPSRGPSEPARSHDDCSCEDSYAALVPGLETPSSSIQSPQTFAPSRFSETVRRCAVAVPQICSGATNLPPPDILLLKSTLLI
ncbi:MAG: hypothetical protein CL908_22980 [Deltaproteobacteria bacterium]|nr:hypothetical protein [Deltaproteobacteria bacterium]